MPGDAGIVDDAAGTTGSKPVRRIAEAPSDATSPGDLTIEDYRRKHKLLDEDRVAGNLTKEEFNDLLAELWSCVRK